MHRSDLDAWIGFVTCGGRRKEDSFGLSRGEVHATRAAPGLHYSNGFLRGEGTVSRRVADGHHRDVVREDQGVHIGDPPQVHNQGINLDQKNEGSEDSSLRSSPRESVGGGEHPVDGDLRSTLAKKTVDPAKLIGR